MQLPRVRGLIRRRILVNYRVDPEVASLLLPRPFVPKLVNGFAMAGICLIRLERLRPAFSPLSLGLSSENAAHRVAVRWTDSDGEAHEGVYIPRRDSNSRFNHLAGGRLFPGEHHRAEFRVRRTDHGIGIDVWSLDGHVAVVFRGSVAPELNADSIFASLDEASAFFAGGATGYSETAKRDHYDGLRLATKNWHVEPLAAEEAHSSFFCDPDRFPAGSVAFDCALLMSNLAHEWQRAPALSRNGYPSA